MYFLICSQIILQKIEWINAKFKKPKPRKPKIKTNKIIPKRKQNCPHDKKQKSTKNKMLSYIQKKRMQQPKLYTYIKYSLDKN